MSNQGNTEWIAVVAIGDIALVFAAVTVVVHLARRIRQPAVVGEIVAGLALGPSLLGLLPGNIPETLFPPEVQPVLKVVAEIGLLLFIFLIGWEFDFTSLRGRRGATGAVWAGGVAVPMLIGLAVAALLYGSYDTVDGEHVPFVAFALFLAVAVSIAGLPVIARIVGDLRLHLSRVGTLGLALAALDDVLAWSLLAIVAALVTASGAAGFLATIGWALLFVLGMVVVVRPLLARLSLRHGRSAAPYLPMLAAAGALCCAYLTAQIGVHSIFGAFVFGLVCPRGTAHRHLWTAVQTPLENISGMLLPMLFVVTGLSVDLTRLDGTAALHMLVIILLACLAKIGGVVVPARLTGTSWRESTLLGLLMNTRGLTQLVILTVGLDLGLLSTELFTALAVMALFTTAMTAPAMSLVIRRCERRAARSASSVDGGPLNHTRRNHRGVRLDPGTEGPVRRDPEGSARGVSA